MDIKLQKLLDKIGMSEQYFEHGNLTKIRCNKIKNNCCFFIELEEILPVETYDIYCKKLKETFNEFNDIVTSFMPKKIDATKIDEYYNYLINKYSNNSPLLNLFKDCKIELKDNKLSIEVDNKAEEVKLSTIKDELEKELLLIGFGEIDIDIIINEENSKKILELINKNLESSVAKVPAFVPKEEAKPEPKWKEHMKDYKKKPPEEGCIMGKKIDGNNITPLKEITDDLDTVIIECNVFGSELIETKNGLKITTLKVTDYTDSIYCKLFSRTEEEYSNIAKIKKGSWLRIRGYVKNDDYSHELVLMPRDIMAIEHTLEKRKDNEKEKRVELHAHTKMSQMDGVADEVALVKQAMAWGHSGIAITDHDCCQAFPHVFSEVTSFNKSKKKAAKAKIEEIQKQLDAATETKDEELIKQLQSDLAVAEEEKKNIKFFKAAYGSELDMCESYLNVCFNANDEQIENNTFVVFDTETTGFNPGLGDSMIEIGGVKVINGEVIDRFDELINPGHPIDKEITNVTDISDDDVKDADNEENVTKRFKEWIGNLPLVAHNARFDKNMLDMAYYKYDLGNLENPIVDTLMLSRIINPDLKKHSLKALGKFYGIDTGEMNDDDDEDEQSVSSSDVKLDNYIMNEVEDVLVDNESVIKNIENDFYLTVIHKSSKSETANIIVKLKSGNDINETVKLHPANNEFDLPYNDINTIKVNIYVGQHHGADVDSENTAYMFNKMLKQIVGINTLNELNDLGKLEILSFENDHKKLSKINELCSYKNYVREVKENEVVNSKFGYPFDKYENKQYVWKYEWCHDDWLQMYENIPGKTFTEHLANVHDRIKHVTFLAKNKTGLKNLFKIVSYANSNFIQRNARIPRKLINENREGILVGTACLNGEIFDLAESRCDEDLIKAMEFYDYIEIQPIENYLYLVKNHDIDNRNHLEKLIKKIITCAKKANKIVVATGDVHNINKEDNLYREIIVNQNVPGKGRHPLARYLHGDPKTNINLENIEKLIKSHNLDLNTVDLKVLKYIYTLTNLKTIPITLDNLCELYVTDKNNKNDIVKNNDEIKKESISSSIRKLQTANVIERSIVGEKVCFTFAKGFRYYNKTKLSEIGEIPNQYFRTTKEMLDSFYFLEDDELVKEIVIDNPNKIIAGIEEIEVVVYPDKPFSPEIEHSQETCRDLVFDKAHSMYGDPLPRNIEDRIAQEFYGDKIDALVKEKIAINHPEMSEEKQNEIFPSVLHDIIMSGYDGVVKLKAEQLKRNDDSLEGDALIEQAKAELSGIIGGGFDVIYLIAQKLVKHSNDDGYLVGSRGSVGSSFVASMMGITECNGLPAHYYCPKCQYSEFKNDKGEAYSDNYPSGFDLPEKDCPKCGAGMIHQGNDMPFATFLGFSGEKVPDIDLNFSGDNQASAHEYTKVLFGTDNVYRAGTISTVADKTAYGYVLGFFEEQQYNALKIEAASYNLSVPGKDDLKKKGIIKCSVRVPEVERISIGCTDVKRTTGQHPGGIVVVPGYKDIWDFTPFQYPADDPTSAWRTTHFDYHAIDADLLKLDILGHDDPTVLRMLQDLSGIDVTKIDLGDLDTMKIFTGPEILGVEKDRLRGLTTKDGRKYCPTGTLGIPEFGTTFLLGMLEETKPTTFAELIKISGLSHGTDVWLGNARDLCTPDENGNIKVPFKNVIGCRDDIMVNLIQWGMKPAKAFKIMEFVRKGRPSKSKKPDDPQTWLGYKDDMRAANIPEWYIDSCQKIKYMFPKAHATAYVTSAFRIAWFKVHMPIFYYAAYFSIRCDQFDVQSMIQGEDGIRAKIDELEEKQATKKASNKDNDTCAVLYLCLEMCARGFYFKNVDIEKSDAKKFVVTEDQKGLIIPFKALDGLGESVAETIVKQRQISPFISIEDLRSRGGVSVKLIEQLKLMGVLDGMPESNQLSLF